MPRDKDETEEKCSDCSEPLSHAEVEGCICEECYATLCQLCYDGQDRLCSPCLFQQEEKADNDPNE